MRSALSLSILLAFVASAATAASDDPCSARADAVVDRIRAEDGALSEREVVIAHAAAFAACSGKSRAPETDGESAETEADPGTSMERFWAGLLSIENRPVGKRSGKYRYVEK